MELTKEEILGYAFDGAGKELRIVRRVFGEDHENYKHAEEVYHTLYKLYQEEHIKNLIEGENVK